MSDSKFNVGMQVYVFDENYRTYKDRRLIVENCFRLCVIDSETSKSWIAMGRKFKKSDPQGLFTEETKNDWLWNYENRYKIAAKVRDATTDQLRKIAGILGYVQI